MDAHYKRGESFKDIIKKNIDEIFSITDKQLRYEKFEAFWKKIAEWFIGLNKADRNKIDDVFDAIRMIRLYLLPDIFHKNTERQLSELRQELYTILDEYVGLMQAQTDEEKEEKAE